MKSYFLFVSLVNTSVRAKSNLLVQNFNTLLNSATLVDAKRICCEFYETLGVPAFKVNSTLINAGGHGAVFKCATVEDGVMPSEIALKYYFLSDDKNITHFQMKNEALDRAGTRPKLYRFHDRGYFEEWLGDYTDLKRPDLLSMYDCRLPIARELAKLHSVKIENIDDQIYTEFVPDPTGWNTRHIKSHFLALEAKAYKLFGNYDTIYKVLDYFDWSYADYRFNIDWVEKLVLDHYDETEKTVFCHNDPHYGNMMVRKDDLTGESLTLIDFDSSEYGYRSFDLAYSLVYMGLFTPDKRFPDQNVIDEYLIEYKRHYTGDDKDVLTLEQLKHELDIYLTYVILEQQFYLGGVLNDGPATIAKSTYFCKFEQLQRKFNHPDPVDCMNSEKKDSSSNKLKDLFFSLNR